jgi:hypothetical protein
MEVYLSTGKGNNVKGDDRFIGPESDEIDTDNLIKTQQTWY